MAYVKTYRGLYQGIYKVTAEENVYADSEAYKNLERLEEVLVTPRLIDYNIVRFARRLTALLLWPSCEDFPKGHPI